MSFDTTKLSNFGKNVAKDYGRFRRSNDKLTTEIEGAIKAGLSSKQIERAVVAHLSNRNEVVDVLSVLIANEQIEERKEHGSD